MERKISMKSDDKQPQFKIITKTLPPVFIFSTAMIVITILMISDAM